MRWYIENFLHDASNAAWLINARDYSRHAFQALVDYSTGFGSSRCVKIEHLHGFQSVPVAVPVNAFIGNAKVQNGQTRMERKKQVTHQ